MATKKEIRDLQEELSRIQSGVHAIRMRTKTFLLHLPKAQRDAIHAKDNNFWRKLRRHFGNDITLTRLQKVLTIIAGK